MVGVLVDNGLGRHLMDPSVLPHILKYSYYLWITQILSKLIIVTITLFSCSYTLLRHHRRGFLEVVYLRLVARAKLLQRLPRRHLAVHSHGHWSELLSSSADTVRVYTVGEELELWI